jgi:hypothetical protein
MVNNRKYIMKQIFANNSKIITNLNLILISILPIGIVAGSLISNIIIGLIGILFVIEVIIKDECHYFNEANFYFLIIINIYLVLNSYFISANEESVIKSIGFIRFIIMAYAISYYFKKFDKIFLRFWLLFFLIVSVDLLIELFFGKNILGYESSYPGRLAGFSGDELKIGGFYFGFIFLSLSTFINKKNYLLFIFSALFFVIALFIGERSNFIKIFTMYLIFFIFFIRTSNLKKFLVIFIMCFLSILIISQNPNLKGKFVNQIFNTPLKSYLNANQKIVTGKGLHSQTEVIEFISYNQHFSHYYVALKIFNDNKLFGSGFKSFRIESNKPEYKKEVFGSSTHPHQFHFELLSELGAIGYILIISNLLFVVFRYIQSSQKNAISNCALIFIIVSIIPILPTGSFFTSYGATIFFINYSFLIRPNYLNKVKNKSE